MRLSASIVIPAWNEWSLTRECLETLRPTLGLRDEVIVVDNGSTDQTASGLRRYPWVKVVRHPENLGFAAGCNSGAAVASRDVVVFLNNDTLLPARWLDGLLAPFSDPTVGATGPRSNFVSGPQLVEDAPYVGGRTADLQRFARAWRDEHRGATDEVTRLVGFCLAVRRGLLEELGGFDEQFGIGGAEDDDLCLRIVDAGHRLLIAHESFVHHHGHRTFEANGVDWFALQEENLQKLSAKRGRRQRATDPTAPFLSACLIVKDEQDNLPSCLESLRGLVDEVVVYDTGSTDGTIELARAAGATVVEGYWDDDFGRARNAALDHCRGEWVLSIDADEVVTTRPEAVRRELRVARRDALAVTIENLSDDGRVGLVHTAPRLFRRGRARWLGTLHEQLVDHTGEIARLGATTVVLRHSGYTTAAFETKDKSNRNLRVARAGVDNGGDLLAVVNLGRALRSLGRYEEALAQFERAIDEGAHAGIARQARRVGAETLMDLGRSRQALGWIDELRRLTASTTVPDYLEGVARLNLLDTDGALRLLDGLTDVGDEDVAIPDSAVRARRGLVLVAAGRWAAAATELLTAALDGGTESASWAELVEAHWRAGLPMAPVLAALPDDLVPVLGRVANATPLAADALAEALWENDAPRTQVLALVSALSDRLPLNRALEWSARLRTYGLEEACPIASLARNFQQPALERLRACAVLTGGFADPRGEEALRHVAASVAPADFLPALEALDELCPSLLPAFVRAAATTRDRAVRLARVLESLGAGDVASELLELSA